MNKLILQNKILYTILGILLLFPFALSAQAPPRLEVVFTPNPLFSEDSVLPGDGVSGTVMVTNNSGESQTIITETINVSDPDGLSDRMNVTITDDSANTFFDAGSGTFFDFLTGSTLTLTDSLGDRESVEYTFEVSYLEGTGNAYQNTEFGFDLCIGFLDELSGINCGDTVVSGEGNTDEGGEVSGDSGGAVGGSGGGGGGGGIIDSSPLTISDEQVEELDTDVQTALIVWDTNQYATSQVVYGLASGGPYSLSLLTPNFGYPSSTPETAVKVLHHEVLLEGLIPDEAYNYRVVSRASPPTISYEHTFTFEEEVSLPPPPILEQGGERDGNQVESQAPEVGLGGGIALSVDEGGGSGEEPFSSEESKNLDETTLNTLPIISTRGNGSEVGTVEEENADASSQLAGPIFGLPTNLLLSDGILACLVLSGLALASIYLMWLVWTLKNRARYTKENYRRHRRIYYPTALLVVSVIAYIFGVLCVVVPLLIALVLSIIWAVLDSRKSVGQSEALNA